MNKIITYFTLVLATVVASSRLVYGKSLTSCEMDTSYKFMSSRTSYHLVGNSISYQDYIMPQCKQIGLYHVSRHAGRYPDSVDIAEMNKVTKDLKSKILKNNIWLCDADLSRMQNWKTRINLEYDHILTQNGRFYMKSLGNRMHNRLFDLISTLDDVSSQIKVQTTEYIRTQQSADEYLNGLLNFTPDRPKYDISEDEDYLLKCPDVCQKYIKTMEKKSSYCPELKEFEDNSPLYNDAKKRFANKIGLDWTGNKLSNAYEYALKMCQYEYIIDGTDSVWCKYFDTDMLKLSEYREDIKNNCRFGYRHNVTRMMTCDLVKNLLENLKVFQNGFEKSEANEKKIQLLFSHTSTLVPFYAILEINKDASNFDLNNIHNENVNRKYRSTFQDPMNSNVAFVLYKCNSVVDDNQHGYRYSVRVFHNENLIKLEACKTTDCELRELVEHFGKFVNQCGSSKEVCRIDDDNTTTDF